MVFSQREGEREMIEMFFVIMDTGWMFYSLLKKSYICRILRALQFMEME